MNEGVKIFVTMCPKFKYWTASLEQSALRYKIVNALKGTKYKTLVYAMYSGFVFIVFHNLKTLHEKDIVMPEDFEPPMLTPELADLIGLHIKLGIPLRAISEQRILYLSTHFNGDWHDFDFD